MSSGINRNIVECKVVTIQSFSYSEEGINRNIVECKVFPDVKTQFLKAVLIETSWNVKESPCL